MAVVVAALMSLGTALVFISPASALESMFVDIRAGLDLPHAESHKGPKAYAASEVLVGAGPELTALDLTDNPSDWRGDIAVDVDDIAGTITVSADGKPWDFETVKVSLATAAINSFEFSTLELVSDELLEEGTPDMLSFGVADGEISLDWDVARGMDDPESTDMTGSAVFKYTRVKKAVPAETTLAWDVYVACSDEEVAVPFNFSWFANDVKLFDFDAVTPLSEGGGFTAGDYKVVIDAGVEFQAFERFIRVVEGKQNYFAFPILPVGMDSDCINDGGATPTPTESTTPPAETTPATTPPVETTPATTPAGTTPATTPAAIPATTPATAPPASKAPVLAVTGAGSHPFLLVGALLMGGSVLLLANRTLRSRKH